MLKLGLILGGIVGALVATLLTAPKEEPPVEETEPKNLVDKVKSQVREAQIAAQTEKQAREAELLAEYEATVKAREQAH